MSEDAQSNKKVIKVAVIEDNALLRDVLKKKFTLEGFNVVEAKDGEEGLALVLQEHPDIILLDVLMPKMDGITMMKKLREIGEWGKKVPIIFLTNVSVDDERANQMIAENTITYYLVKSDYKINDLVEKIKGIVS